MYSRLRTGLVFFVALGCISCSGVGSTDRKNEHPGKVPAQQYLILTGTVQFIDLEGGCWQLVLDDGTRYELIGGNLAATLRAGIRIEAEVKRAGNINTICQIGEAVELTRIVNTIRE